jgi:hypothetical protein
MCYFLMDWRCYDFEEDTKSHFSWTEERRILAGLRIFEMQKGRR